MSLSRWSAWILALAAPAAAQGITWQQLMPANSPPARGWGHSMAMDLARAEVVLFGGYGSSGQSDETWTWNGNNWARKQPASSPTPRDQGALVLDLARARLVLFGGRVASGVMENDTWTWDGNNWTRLTTSGTPVARYGHEMVYDSARDRVVVFGGRSSYTRLLGDTLEFDGNTNTWTQVATTGPGRLRNASMAYDPVRQRTVLFGGNNGSSTVDGTWEFDGATATWTQMFPAVRPGAREAGAMTYDPVRQRVVMFGGVGTGNYYYGDTWEWDGNTWVDVTPAASPSARQGVRRAHVYNPVTGRSLFFGGTDGTSHLRDTWVRTSVSPPSLAPYGAGCPGSAGVPNLASDGRSLPWLGDTFRVVLDNLPANSLPWVVVGFGRTNQAIPGAPGCRQLVAAPLAAFALGLTGSSATWSVTVPNDTNLIGLLFHLQGMVLSAGGSNPFGLATSNALEGMIGAR